MDLTPLLRARSVAVVGASPKPDAFGGFVLRQLRDIGFAGDVVLVNPGYDEIDGIPAVASIPAAGSVDCAAICLADERILPALEEAAATGVRSAVIFGAAAGTSGSTAAEQRSRIAEVARAAEMPVLGAACMGFYNFVDPLYLTGYPHHSRPDAGPVGFITHSGSVFSAIAKNTRDLRMNFCVSTGQELVTTAADYLRFLIDQPTTRVVGMFLETVRDPERFLEALREAERRNIAVVVLKVGRSVRGSQLALAHSGAIAGSHSAYRAVFEAHNVVEVGSLDEMVDTLELFAAGRTPTTDALGAITDSGGERALLVDLASELGVSFANPTPATVDALREHLDPSLEPANPADLWGSGHDWQRSYDRCIGALVADPGVGAFAYAIDFNVGSRLTGDYLELAIRHAASTDKPFAVIGNISAGLDPVSAATLRAAGVPVLHGTEIGLRAFQHLLRHAGRRRRPVEIIDLMEPVAMGDNLLVLLGTEVPLTEQASLTLLAQLGVPVVASSIVGSVEELVVALATTSFPVVMKTATAGIAHKSDAGGVVTGIATLERAVEVYRGMAERLGPDVMVQRQVDLSRGTELFLGLVVDDQFGPVVSVGAGGLWVETMGDMISLMPPVSPAAASSAIERLRVWPLLTGARGRSPANLDRLVDVIVAFGRAAVGLAGLVSEIDVNPLYVGPDEVVALDALVVPKHHGPGGSGAP